MWSPQGWMNDWEVNSIIEFHKQPEKFIGTRSGDDTLKWQGNSRGKFSVNAAYKMLNQPRIPITNWPWKHIWKSKVPYKVVCFSWLLAKEAVLTQKNLIKRKWIPCSRCFLCVKKAETVGHSFLHCNITNQ